MTQEEVRQLAELQKKFEKRCKEVCSILKDFDGYYEDLCYFVMAENVVVGFGYDNYDYELLNMEFGASFLTADDDVIRDYVKDEIRKQEDERQRIKESLEAKEREQEMALLKKLKEKYEN
jgi:hypothetical protein